MSLCDFPYVLKIRDNTLDKEDAGTASELWSHYRGWYCAPNRTSAIQTMKMIVVTYFYCYLILVIYYLFICKLKDEGRDFEVKWKILQQHTTYNPTNNSCRLCLSEKFTIMFQPELATRGMSSTCGACKK